MVRWLTAALATFVLLVAHAALPIGAAAQDNPLLRTNADVVSPAATSLALVQQCSGGNVNVTFYWQGNDPSAIQQWIDLSTIDGNFYPGTFISAGPFAGFTNSYTWYGIAGGMMHYVRLNQQLSNGAWDGGVFTFTSNICAGSPVIPSVPLVPFPPAPGPNAGGQPSILSLSCTSSTATATLSNVSAASTQNVGLNALPYDTINCTATVAGQGQLAWRGPNGEQGFSQQFSTQIGAPKLSGAPYDISLTLNWGGNPAMAHVSVTPIQPNIYNPYNPYNPYTPYTPYPTFCASGMYYPNGACY